MKTKIFITACLVMILAIALVIPLATVSADYQDDILNNPDAIVNMNQLLNFSTTSSSASTGGVSFTHTDNNYFDVTGTTTSTQWLNTGITGFSVIAYHQYYFYINSSVSSIWLSIASNNIDIQNNPTSNIKSFDTSYSNCSVYIKCYEGSYSDFIEFYCIDLTLMFGSGNEPTLTQCQDIFVSDYYAYNTGSAMKFNSLYSYAQGYNDAFSDYDIAFSADIVNNSIFGVNGEPVLPVSNYLMIGNDNTVYGLNFNATFSNNDIITIHFTNLAITTTETFTSNYDLEFGLYNNGQFTVLNSIHLGTYDSYNSTLHTYKYTEKEVSFNINQTTTAIYFRCNAPGISTFDTFTVSVRTHNMALAIQSAYDEGYYNGVLPYQVGGTEYQRIYNLGKTAGINEQNPYTFSRLMGSVVDAPLQAVLSIFNFEFLGYNLKNLITLLLTVCLVIAVIRYCLGG